MLFTGLLTCSDKQANAQRPEKNAIYYLECSGPNFGYPFLLNSLNE